MDIAGNAKREIFASFTQQPHSSTSFGFTTQAKDKHAGAVLTKPMPLRKIGVLSR
jgi:hypothetical protein